jgi:NADPH:quinone reductase-like Zn-dependent oxidoreductase
MSSDTTMQAAWFEEFGTAVDVLRVGERPKPSAGPGEVLIKLRTSGINPSDVKKRAGSAPTLLDAGYVIPNSDGAGVIEAVGEGIDMKRIGERVWVYQAQFGRRFGTAAQYVALDALRAVPLPIETSFEEGACAGIPIMTAHRCVHADGPIAGQTVLVTGGAGRVGYYAIQWAKMAGAKVIASASNARDEALCLEAGAKHVFNHRERGWGERVKALNGGKPVDRVIDVEFGANLPEVLECVRAGAVIATYSSTQVKEPQLPFLRMMFQDLTLRLVLVYVMPEAAKKHAVADITQAFRHGMLLHRIGARLPLAEIAHASELVEQGGSPGCVILELPA